MIFIAGNLAWQTEVVSFLIFVRLQEFEYPAAAAIASVVLMTSLVLLLAVNIIQSRAGLRTGGLMADTLRRRRFPWQKWLLISAGLLLTFFILVIPLVWIL